MKTTGKRTIPGLALFVWIALMAGGPSVAGAHQDDASPCGKGYAAEESRTHLWRGLPRTLSPVLEIVLPPLTNQVSSMGERTGQAPASSGRLARAEWTLLGGAISAVVSAGLAAIGSLESDDAELDPATELLVDVGSGQERPSPCSETGGTGGV